MKESKNRADDTLKAELPLLVSSSKESSSANQECTSGDETVTKAHNMKWSAKFDEFKKRLNDEEKDLVRIYIIYCVFKSEWFLSSRRCFNVFEIRRKAR